MKHLISVDDYDLPFISEIFRTATEYKFSRLDATKPGHSRRIWDNLSDRLKNYLLITDFFEPSTRTRFSFEAAISYMGGHVIGTENAAEFSSFKKGESLSDNFRVISGYGDIIVGRFLHEGDAKIAAEACDIPLINGGDGKGEHPTQALIDLFSIIEKFPEPESLRVTFLGDNAYSRTVQSLARLLARFPCVRQMNFVGPPEVNIRESDAMFLTDLHDNSNKEGHIVSHTVINSLDENILRETDILYVTRPQIERHYYDTPNKPIVKPDDRDFTLNAERADMLPETALILHPLPRNNELPPEVDANPRSYYFQQARNGLFVRMALLEALCLRY